MPYIVSFQIILNSASKISFLSENLMISPSHQQIMSNSLTWFQRPFGSWFQLISLSLGHPNCILFTKMTKYQLLSDASSMFPVVHVLLHIVRNTYFLSDFLISLKFHPNISSEKGIVSLLSLSSVIYSAYILFIASILFCMMTVQLYYPCNLLKTL